MLASNKRASTEMNLNLDLWVAMAAAALFFHHANRQKVHPAFFVMASVMVSALVMLLLPATPLAVLGGQVGLFVVIAGLQRLRK